MSRDRAVTFACPLCPDAELTGTVEPPGGSYVLDLVGCPHADAYSEGVADQDTTRAIERAVNAACDEAGRAAMDDADESRVAAWEAREER